MMKHTLAALTMTFFAAGLTAGCDQLAEPGGVKADPTEAAAASISADAMRGHIAFLADDLLEGREAGTRGHEIAARYAASQFAVMGLAPAGDDGTFYQQVPFRTSRHLEGSEEAVILRRDGSQPLTYLDDYFFSGRVGGFGYKFEVVDKPLVFVGFAVTAPELGYDDFAGIDVTDKVAIVLSGAPARFDTDERAFYSSRPGKLQRLVDAGAAGMIFVSTPIDEARYPWERVVKSADTRSFRWLDGDGKPWNGFTSLQAGAYFSHAGAEKLFAGAPQTLAEVFEKSESGSPNSFDLGHGIRLSRASEQEDVQSPNVAAVLRGSDPALADEYVVFTAHLDHIGISENAEGDDKINNGAYDNATGSAMVLEIARAFASMPTPPRRSIIFLLVTAEEKGLLGSEYFAKHPTVPADAIVADVNLDMPVLTWPMADLIVYGANHSSLGPVVEAAAETEGLFLSPDPYPEEVIFIRSDQFSFIKEGIPVVYMDSGQTSTDPAIDGAAAMGEFLKSHYHRPSDQFDLPFDKPSAEKLARTGFRMALAIANAEARPTWNADDFFGDRFAGKPEPGGAGADEAAGDDAAPTESTVQPEADSGADPTGGDVDGSAPGDTDE